jgi:AcrR family transcriptional regulator
MNMFTSATTKGARTRGRILDAALALFTKQGFASTTLRDIAGEANASLGLTYRYFKSKEELLGALYEQIAERVAKHVPKLPSGTIAERFEAFMDHKLRLLAPHKEAFGALLSAAVDPSSRASVLGDASSGVRATMRTALHELVGKATDAPDDLALDGVAATLYTAHFALLLVWVHDDTRGARRTRDLLTTTCSAIAFARPFLGAPGAAAAFARLADVIAPIFWKEKSP